MNFGGFAAPTARQAVTVAVSLFLILLPCVSFASSWILTANPLPEDEDLVLVTGHLELPDGEDPLDYLVVNAFEVASPGADGSFEIHVRGQGPTVNAAARRDIPGQGNPWVGVIILNEGGAGEKTLRLGTKSSPALRINPRSTAKALVQASPLVLGRDPHRALLLDAALEALPQLDTLEEVIRTHYAANPGFAEVPEIRAAVAGVIGGLERMLPHLPPRALGTDGYTSATLPAPAEKSSHLPVRFNSLDPMRQVEYQIGSADVFGSADLILLEATEFVPLDAIATMKRLSSDDQYRYTDEKGNSGRINSLHQATRLRNLPGRHLIFDSESESTDPQVAVLSAKSLFRWVSTQQLAREALGAGAEFFLPGSTVDGRLLFDPFEDGVYIIRVHNGKFFDGIRDTSGEGAVVLDEFGGMTGFALTVNFTMAIMDVIDLIVGFRVDACNPLALFLPALATEVGRQSWIAAETNPSNAFDAAFGIVTVHLPVMLDNYTDCILSQPGTALLAFAKSVLTLEQIGRRVSSVGSIADRLSALFSAPLGGVVGPMVAPMDTVLVIVGDPFSPTIETISFTDWEGAPSSRSLDEIDTDTPPPGVTAESEVTITGRRLIDGEDRPRHHAFVDIYGNRVAAEVIDASVVGDMAREFPLEEVVLRLPPQLLGPVSFQVSSGRAGTPVKTPEFAEIVPTITSITPVESFGRGGSYTATVPTQVYLHGVGLDRRRHTIMLGDREYFGNISFQESPLLFFPTLDHPPGLHEVRVRWRDGVEPAGGNPPVLHRLFPPPQLDTVAPATVPPRGYITLTGRNFGRELDREHGALHVAFLDGQGQVVQTAIPRRVRTTGHDGGDQFSTLVAEVPMVGEETGFDVEVRTPRGASPRLSITVSPEADPPYSRTIRNYNTVDGERVVEESSQLALSWANNNPAPPGQRQWVVECVPQSCPDTPELGTSVHQETLPAGSPMHSSIGIVSNPPGIDAFPGISAENCGPCDNGAPSNPGNPADPDNWGDLTAGQIQDTVLLTGDVEGVYTSRHATIRATTDSGRTEAVRITGNGLLLDGARDVDVTIRPTAIESGTILTVRNATNVTIDLDIHESATGAADVGVYIENSFNVSVTGVIRRCTTGVLVRNSEAVDLDFIRVYTHGADSIGIDVDGGSMLNITQNIVRGGPAGITGGHTGYRLRGGAREVRFASSSAFGLDTGVLLEDVSDSNFTGSLIGEDSPAQDRTPNRVGLHVTGGVADSHFRQLTFRANDIGLLVEGGTNCHYVTLHFGFPTSNADADDGNRIGMQIEDVGQPLSGNSFWEMNFNWNRQNHLRIINADNPGLLRALRLGVGYTPDKYPPTFEAGLVIDGARDISINNLEASSANMGAIIRDSSRIRIENALFQQQTDTGLRAERTSLLALEDFQVTGASSGPESNRLKRGLHLVACSGLQLAKGDIIASTIAGIDIEQPPMDATGVSRLMGRKRLPGATAPPEDPPRETFHDPFRRTPLGDFNTQDTLQVRAGSGPAVVVRDGAEDIVIFGALLSSFDGPALLLDGTGPNVSVLSSRIFCQQSATGTHPSLLVRNNDAEGVMIGQPGLANEIVSATGWGVEIEGSRHVRLLSNFIGTSGAGLSTFSNASGGVRVTDSGDIEIGGPDPEEGNLVSGNQGPGVAIHGLGPGQPPLVQGNFIGTNSGGVVPMENAGPGIIISPATELPGPGGARIRDNLISGNAAGGVAVEGIQGSEGTVLLERNIIGRAFPFGHFGDFIGAETSDGDAILLSRSAGVVLVDNRIAWHEGNGLTLLATDRIHLQDNAIFAHGGAGVDMIGSSGGTTLVNNEISNNALSGISIGGLSSRNTILGGGIHGNGTRAITLARNANDNIPPPLLCDVYMKELPDGTGVLYAEGLAAPFIPDGARVELFVSTPDGQAAGHLASTVLFEGSFFAYLGEVEPGAPIPQLAATVTDLKGNTSELGFHDPGHPDCLDPDTRRAGRDDPEPPEVDPGAPGQAWAAAPVAMESEGALFLTTLTGGEPAPILTGLDPSLHLHSPSLVRRTGGPNLITFTATDSSDADTVHIMNVDSPGTASPATGELSATRHPRLSPGGTHLALVSDDGGADAVYLIDLSGDSPARLSPEGRTALWPDWSPDGASLVYLDVTETPALWIVQPGDDAPPAAPLPMDSPEGTIGRPAWGVIEGRIAFELAPPGGPARVGWVDRHSGETYLLPLLGEESQHEPAWGTGSHGEPLLLHTVRQDGAPATIHLTDAYGYPHWQVSPLADENDHTGAAAGARR